MSYDVILRYGERTAEVPPHSIGGTILVDSRKACLNVTFNYNLFFQEHLGDEGIYWLYGKEAFQTINRLEKSVDALRTFAPDRDYWKSTAGNAKVALSILLGWARLHPRATWKVI